MFLLSNAYRIKIGNYVVAKEINEVYQKHAQQLLTVMSRLLNDKRNRKIGNVAKIFANPVSVKIKKEVSTRILGKYIEIEKSSFFRKTTIK